MTDAGKTILENLSQKKEGSIMTFDVKTIFSTQERQLLLG